MVKNNGAFLNLQVLIMQQKISFFTYKLLKHAVCSAPKLADIYRLQEIYQ